MHPTETLVPSSDAIVAAFYARVMRRVCDQYRESEGADAQAIAVVQLKWAQRLTCYTGVRPDEAYSQQPTIVSLGVSTASPDAGQAEISGAGGESEERHEETSHQPEQPLLASDDTQAEPAASLQPPRPHGQPTATPPAQGRSVFAKMMSRKRRMEQVDGSVDPDSDDEVKPPADPEEAWPIFTERVLTPSVHAQASQSITQAIKNGLVTKSDVIPVSSLSVNHFPMQMSAQYSQFGYRGKRHGYMGKLHAIILTLPRVLTFGDVMALRTGQLLWFYHTEPRQPHSGEMVEVITQDFDQIQVKMADGQIAVIPTTHVRILHEFLIRTGVVNFRREIET